MLEFPHRAKQQRPLKAKKVYLGPRRPGRLSSPGKSDPAMGTARFQGLGSKALGSGTPSQGCRASAVTVDGFRV